MTDDIASLPPDKIKAAIEKLEADKPLVAEVLTVERSVVDPETNEIIRSRDASPLPPKVEPRPRKRPRAAPPATEPQWFYITMGKPSSGDPGRIEEGWYVIHDGQVFLCNAAGVVEPEGRQIEPRGATYTARTMLRAKLNARPPSPNHERLVYPKLVY